MRTQRCNKRHRLPLQLQISVIKQTISLLILCPSFVAVFLFDWMRTHTHTHSSFWKHSFHWSTNKRVSATFNRNRFLSTRCRCFRLTFKLAGPCKKKIERIQAISEFDFFAVDHHHYYPLEHPNILFFSHSSWLMPTFLAARSQYEQRSLTTNNDFAADCRSNFWTTGNNRLLLFSLFSSINTSAI